MPHVHPHRTAPLESVAPHRTADVHPSAAAPELHAAAAARAASRQAAAPSSYRPSPRRVLVICMVRVVGLHVPL